MKITINGVTIAALAIVILGGILNSYLTSRP
jgi:hypothetical protein